MTLGGKWRDIFEGDRGAVERWCHWTIAHRPGKRRVRPSEHPEGTIIINVCDDMTWFDILIIIFT
jgi:hypothetical protein